MLHYIRNMLEINYKCLLFLLLGTFFVNKFQRLSFTLNLKYKILENIFTQSVSHEKLVKRKC